jgi:hypothetical protein
MPYFYGTEYDDPTPPPEFPCPILIAVSSENVAKALRSIIPQSVERLVAVVGDPLAIENHFKTAVILLNENDAENLRWFHNQIRPALAADCKQVWPR